MIAVWKFNVKFGVGEIEMPTKSGLVYHVFEWLDPVRALAKVIGGFSL